MNSKIVLTFLALCFSSFSFSSTPKDFFHDDFLTNRKVFIQSIRKLSFGKHIIIKNPSKLRTDLTTDIFYYNPPQAKKLFILTSGIHGTEANTGSAALIDFLKNHIQKYKDKKVSFLLIHSLNPFGHHFKRRFNENNIDLNRNLSLHKLVYQTQNMGYNKLSYILAPREKLISMSSFSITFSLLKELFLRSSFSEIRQAIVGGQYQNPKGLYFGGFAPETITRKLSIFLKEIFTSYSSIFHIDFHTGLGEKGVMHIMAGENKHPKAKGILSNLFPPITQSYKFTYESDKGFYQTRGDLITFMNELSVGKLMISVVAEFGTQGIGIFDQIKTLHSLVMENQGEHHGYKDIRLKNKVKSHLINTFYPRDKQWRTKVYKSIQHLYLITLPKFITQKI